MIFAGLTSGYIVSQGSSFWVAIPMPPGFLTSTILIFVSSACLIAASYAVKQGKSSLMNASLGLALLSGIAFGWYQWIGATQLFAKGYAVAGPIVENEGRYGNIFSLSYEGKSISFDKGTFFWQGSEVSDEMHEEIKAIGTEFAKAGHAGRNDFNLNNYGAGFMLYYKDEPCTYANNQLYLGDEPMDSKKCNELYMFGENLANERGDFIMEGVYGEDFWIYYDGKRLEYENRQFYMDGQKLSPKLENDLFGAANTASSYIYALAGVHFLHWIGGVIALLVLFIKGLQNKYTSTNYLGLTLGSMYWHFLGILWLYLYMFLIFIH